MTEVFQRTQEFELKRLHFYKKVLYDLHSCLDITQNKMLSEIYAQLRHTIDQQDASHDLKLWSQVHGADMSMAWPAFEEYSTELHSISNRDNPRSTVAIDNVRLTAAQRTDPLAIPPDSQNAQRAHYDNTVVGPTVSVSSNHNPFGDDEDWNTYANAADYKQTAVSTSGVPVRALFDYVGQEEDELSFQAGDIFVKTKDRDDQGWCTGCKDGRVGLYPDNYVEYISQ
jgi:hypothetical protein